MSIQDDARAALELLRREGWWKEDGSFSAHRGGCLALAANWVNPDSEGLETAIADVIREQYPERARLLQANPADVHVCVAFNDHPDTTFADVEAVLEKVAAS